MTNKELKRVLLRKNITHLYHVNSVATSCTFLENGGLLSHGVVEERGLFQTPQESDEKDKEVDVFYDIFFDSVDIHQRVKKINHYGPVLFVYSVDLLDALPPDTVRITRDNPIRWHAGMTESEKYLLTKEQLWILFEKGSFFQHITLRHQTEPLSFDYLEKVVLDDPKIDNTTYFDNAYQHLKKLMERCVPGKPLEIRQCPPACQCHEQYRSYNELYTYYRFRY